MKKNDKDLVGVIKLARHLEISDRRIQQLVNEGVIHREKKNVYDLDECCQRYRGYLIDKIKERFSTGTKEEEEILWIRERRIGQQIQNRTAEGELIPVREAMTLWQQLVAAGRTRMLAIPSAVKTKHPDLDISIVMSIGEIVRETLEEMSKDGLPERYRKTLDGDSQDMDPAT